jgi:HTH-type transcriptional regulator/antitoxin HipB
MQVITTRDVGALIREARRARRLTQTELSEVAGVTRRWLTDIEQGAKPRAELGLVLATLQALDVRLEATYAGHPDVDQSNVPGALEREPLAPDQGVDLDDALGHYLDG